MEILNTQGSHSMFTYICLGTNDIDRAVRFYDAALGALGIQRCITGDPEMDRTFAGWGTYENDGATEIALWVCSPFNKQAATAGNGTMVALGAKSWSEVENFHSAAIACGGTSEGLPGLRPQYNADFYAAYVRDPDGNKLAAVCRGFTR
jgi:catechol 2,3-dioxygenase-like lactoylglutathione lyase family enzyme